MRRIVVGFVLALLLAAAVAFGHPFASTFDAAIADATCGSICGVANSTLTLTGNSVAVSDPLTIGTLNLSGNAFTNSTSVEQGDVVTADPTPPASALPFPTYGSGHIVLGATGSFIQAINGSVTTSNASPSAGTCSEPLCAVTSGSATATVFNISAQWSVLTPSHLVCRFTPAVMIAYSAVETAANVCTITFASAPTTGLVGTVWFMGNGT